MFDRRGRVRGREDDANSEACGGSELEGATIAGRTVGALINTLRMFDGAEMFHEYQLREGSHAWYRLKILRPELVDDVGALLRCALEARILEHMSHPNVVRCIEAGRHERRPFLVLEQGWHLSRLLSQDALSPVELIKIFQDVCAGLGALHGQGIVHRRVSPDAILVDDSLVGKVMGLEFARAERSGIEDRTGELIGDARYMAAEQASGRTADARADVYAIGVCLYEAFAGTTPFGGSSMTGILTKHITAEPRRLRARAEKNGRRPPSEDLEAVVHQALAKDPAHRFQSMDSLAAALRQVEP